LAKIDEQIKKMRETIEWGEETLSAWNNDLAKRCTDVNILETYNLEDNNRFKVIFELIVFSIHRLKIYIYVISLI